MNVETIIIFISSIIIASYLFGMISKWLKIPSVLLLLSTGLILKYSSNITGISDELMNTFVELFGVSGLIMIVLEASLDLSLERKKLSLIRRSLSSAFFILMVSCGVVSSVVYYALGVSFHTAIIYAIPLSIISSAIVIPSVENLSTQKREFIIYESAFSDILGVILFNYFTLDEVFSASSVVGFAGSFLLIILLSLLASAFLLYLTAKITTHIKFFLLLAILFLLYAMGKLYHLPALLLVLFFGLTLSNFTLIIHPKLKSFLNVDELAPTIQQFKTLTAESSFLIRTFFFILFGFTIDVTTLLQSQVVAIGGTILVVLLLVRTLYFKFFIKTNIFPEILLMPRGLITILLFYSIPEKYTIQYFDKGIMFLIIIGTSLLMMLGLILTKSDYRVSEEIEQS